MKRLLLFFILAGAVATMQATCGNPSPPTPELSTSTERIVFGGDAGEQTFRIKTNVEWKITDVSSSSWCTVSPTSGEGTGNIPVKIAVTRNPVSEDRNATLTISAGGLTRTVTVTQGYLDVLEVEGTRIENIPPDGATVEVKLKTSNTPEVTIAKDWITADGAGTASGDYNTLLRFRIAATRLPMSREGTITFRVGSIEKIVTLVQTGQSMTIAPDATGMDDNAVAMAARMGLGWNLGNTLEPPGGEGTWNNPAVTRELIGAVASAGFKTIRIPCAWDSHIIDRETFLIDPVWLDRVAEVVGWCLDEGLYAMLNIHWDGGWLENHPYYANQAAVNRQQKALWEQIAVKMRDFDQRLIFAGTNEVHHDYNAPSAEHVAVQLSYNQTFVDAVRSTGGRNAYRNLVVQSYNTNIDYAVQYMEMSRDSAAGRLILEVHYYDPYEFTIIPSDDRGLKLVWGNRSGAPVSGNDSRKPTWGDESFADAQFAKMKTGFVDKGIPVIVGEYGSTFRGGLSGRDATDHHASNVYYLGYVTGAMRAAGLVPVYWDNGATSDGSGIFNRNTGAVVHADVLEAMMKHK